MQPIALLTTAVDVSQITNTLNTLINQINSRFGGNSPTTSATGDGSVLEIKNGSLTAYQIYSPLVPAGYYFSDAIRSVVDLEAGTTSTNTTAIAAYVYNNVAAGAGANAKSGVGLYSEVVAATNNSSTWASNFVLSDNTTNGLATLVGRKLIGLEFDFQCNGASTFQGISFIMQGVGTPAAANACQVSISSGATAKWVNAFVVNDAAATTAMIIGATGLAGANIASQPINLTAYDSASTGHYIQLTAIPSGTNAALSILDNIRANGVYISCVAAGAAPFMAAQGTDTNINLDLYGKGVGSVRIQSALTLSTTTLLYTLVSLINNAAAATATLTNAPVAGNPTKWIPINDNGVVRNIPAW